MVAAQGKRSNGRLRIVESAAADPVPVADDAADNLEDLSHNLNGQKLGRSEPADTQISLSAVARKAKLGMTSLYLYFGDLTELLLAVLEPVMAESEAGYVEIMRAYWPDDQLEQCCRNFVSGYYAFWLRNSRILHLRNSMADQYDERMMICRVKSAIPAISLLGRQMVGEGQAVPTNASNTASVLFTAIERAITVATDPVAPLVLERSFGPRHNTVVEPCTRMLFLMIRDIRQATA